MTACFKDVLYFVVLLLLFIFNAAPTPSVKFRKNPRWPVVTQEVDDALVVRREESDCVFEEEHEGCVDHAVGQFVSVDLVRSESSKSGRAVGSI